MEIPTTLYWNCLNVAPDEAKRSYLVSLLKAHSPDLAGITECTESMLEDGFGEQLENLGYDLDYESRVDEEGEREGLLVLSLGSVAIKRFSPWPEVTKTFRGARTDHRQVARVRTEDDFTVFFGHITHPHEHHKLAWRRWQEWREHRELIEAEENPFAWFADTNTIFASTVRRKLGDVVLLEPNRKTWGFKPQDDMKLAGVTLISKERQFWRVLNLDRCAVRPDVAEHASFEVLPPELDGQVCPADHLPILMKKAA